MASRATWADQYRSGHPEAAPWHYVDIDFDRPDLKAACLDRQCLPAKISQIERVLANPAYPPQTRAGALIWLLHLVDDVHQPYTRSTDKSAAATAKPSRRRMGSSRCISGGTMTWSTLFGGRDLGRLGSALARQVMQAELAE